jgi:hypothetical protein
MRKKPQEIVVLALATENTPSLLTLKAMHKKLIVIISNTK